MAGNSNWFENVATELKRSNSKGDSNTEEKRKKSAGKNEKQNEESEGDNSPENMYGSNGVRSDDDRNAM
ncbi:hypothetical protein AB6A40_004344 [Gnathostoma spinigerum]|uniref:Uncharacterized protein n=1 Tax=Gnathostoma spinigerum TaxID=75299 RepID=A0ABD6EDB4_9BILA